MLAAMAVLVTTSAKVGRTALNKLLWFADVAHFLQHGRTISGTVYVKCDYGPAPCDIDAVRHELIARGIVSEKIIKATPYRSFVYKANDAAVSRTRKSPAASEVSAFSNDGQRLASRPAASNAARAEGWSFSDSTSVTKSGERKNVSRRLP